MFGLSINMNFYSFSRINVLKSLQSKRIRKVMLEWQDFHYHYTSARLLDKNTDLVNLIRANTIITRKHLTPEIQLHLITPECALWDCDAEMCPFQDPYWAFYWPGGQAVSRYILENPLVVKHLNVLDIGCGSGACSIASVISGAQHVIGNDIDPVACIATALNASLNGVAFDICEENLLGVDAKVPKSDCIIIGDMFYDEEFSNYLFPWLLHLHSQGKSILIGDPGRLTFARKSFYDSMELLVEYQLLENVCIENNGFRTASVWTLK